MIFVKSDELKIGMRLARPIYNKSGVLLYERNSKLTSQGINSIQNYQLIGIFVLEPAEPVPPMTKDDIAFERFQTMGVFAIQEELDRMIVTKKASKIQMIASDIIRNYGRTDKRVNFIQNLRSKEDYIYKHILNVAILCALITRSLQFKLDEQLDTVIAALVHDIESVKSDKKPNASEIFDNVFVTNPNIKRISFQLKKALYDLERDENTTSKMVLGAKVLLVADMYDRLTAMKFEEDPASEVRAIRFLFANPEVFDPTVVDALIRSINILSAGTCVELNTGEKGLVLVRNEKNILRPTVLCFSDNNILDLRNKWIFGDIEITDIMKTMDNRYIMNIEELKKQGYFTGEPEFI